VHLRPTFFMENFIDLYGQGIVATGTLALPAADGKSHFVATEDIADMAVYALLGDVSGEVWNLTGPEGLTHSEVVATLSAASGRRIDYLDLDPEAHREGMRAFGMGELAVEMMSGLYAAVRQGWMDLGSDDIARVTGRAPLSFARWAALHADAWAAEAGAEAAGAVS
jgi:uncharacterized protein YbjT (DUF2867 family)